MNKDEQMHDDHPGAEELAGRLEAYASARLSPNRRASARIRTALIEEARMRDLETTIGGARHRHGAGPRRAAAVLLAAALGLGTGVVAFAGSAPGTPFYQARVWLETVTLPADADARALERIRQLEGRLVDSEKAAAAADEVGVIAATEAYAEAVDAAMVEVGTDVDHVTRLKVTLGLHLTVLETLADKLPAAAANGIERAIEASQKAVNSLGDRPDRPDKPDGQQGPLDTPGGQGPQGAP